MPRPLPSVSFASPSVSVTPPALLSLTWRLNSDKISLFFHLVGTGLYAGLNVPTV